MDRAYIYYYLMRNSDRCIFYVGMTKDANKRIKMHISAAKKGKYSKDAFIRECNYDISIMPFEIAKNPRNIYDALYREKYWIQQLHRMGHPLLNKQLSYLHKYNFKSRTYYYTYNQEDGYL